MTMVAFVGPTMPVADCRQILDATYLPPVSQGDVYRVAREGPRAIGIIDGFFERVPAVWHKEILWAMSRGIRVFGASSMGALRAAELSAFGMTGVGAIFEAYRDGLIEDDDEVTLVHGDAEAGYPAGSVAMVDIRATLVAAEEAGVLDVTTLNALVAIGKSIFYPDRSYPNLLARARAAKLPTDEIDALDAWLPSGQVSQKRDDAVVMLQAMKAWQQSDEAPFVVDYHFEHTDVWEQVANRSGRQLAAAQPDDLPHEWLVDELRLRRDDYERAEGGALARALALAEAERHDLEVAPALADDAITALRRRHALVEGDALQRWIAAQEMDTAALADLVEHEARIGWVRTMFAPAAARQLPEWLRVSGRYGTVAARARDKQRLLAEHGLENPSISNAPIDEESLMRWFFAGQQGEPTPARLDLHAYAVGCEGRAAFVQTVLREYYYVTLRDTARSR